MSPGLQTQSATDSTTTIAKFKALSDPLRLEVIELLRAVAAKGKCLEQWSGRRGCHRAPSRITRHPLELDHRWQPFPASYDSAFYNLSIT